MADEDVVLVLEEAREAMERSITSMKRDLQRVRTGRASTALLDGITVDYEIEA
jgi:ribosome recycling factor